MASITNSKGPLLLIFGDLVVYLFSLIATLTLRYGEIPTRALLSTHIPSFAVLFVLFLAVAFSAGLYDKQLAFLGRRTAGTLVRVQIINALLGVTFFYLAPVGIAPKASLGVFFVISTACLFLWRLFMVPVVTSVKKQTAILIGSGDDMKDLDGEIRRHSRYGLEFKEQIIPSPSVPDTISAVAAAMGRHKTAVIVVDMHDPLIAGTMPFLYSLVFSGARIINARTLYESVFDRIPLSMVGERWLVENSMAALSNRRVYDGIKRASDIIIAGALGLVSLLVYPFVYAAIKIDDGGSLFIAQERIGKNGKTIKIFKFRSMSGNDSGKYGEKGATAHVVTRVGSFIRACRIDELPQLWNILRGSLSLIGPRPELPALVAVYEKDIPYYNIRHLVKPGLSGWAQIYHEAHPHHAVATNETRNKLSYDLYYIKNRSLLLDLKIVFRTLQIVLKRSGK